jgi:AraC-like DNA-binding protein
MINEDIIYPKNPLIQKYIRSFWILKSNSGSIPYLLPPDRYFNLILSYQSNTNVIKNGNVKNSVSGSFIVGMRTAPVVLVPDGDVEYLGIEFYPYGLRPFLGFNCIGITNTFLEISALRNELSEALKPAINEFYSYERRVEIIEQKLLGLIDKVFLTPTKQIARTLELIVKTNGSIPVNKICDQIGISARQLNRDFENYIGVSPKLYSRIVRFNYFLENVKTIENFADFADLAYHCGYSDQAHMIHECTEFAGITPTKLLTKY